MLEIVFLSLFIAIALSIDAFLACFAYATNENCSRSIKYTPILVGVFHFIFPIISFVFFGLFRHELSNIGRYISSAIFIILGVICFVKKDDQQYQILSFISIILLAAGVSIDSLLVGVSLSFKIKSIIIPALIFGVISGSITYLSIKLGKTIALKSSCKLECLAGAFFILLGLLTLFGII